MRYKIPILFAVFISLQACSAVTKLGHTPAARPPYIVLDDSTTVNPKSVATEDFNKKKILADDKVYKLRNVLEYSDGKQTYTRLPTKGFGPLVFTGRLNVYSNSDVRRLGYQGSYQEHFFIQPASGGDLHELKYRFLRQNITGGQPGFLELQQYKKTRRTLHIIMLGGLATFVAGTAIATSGSTKSESEGRAKIGTYGILAGALGIIGPSFPLMTHRFKLRKIVAIHNGVYP